MRAAAIINMQAGAGAARSHWPRAARMLEDRLGTVEYRFTDGPGHATCLARELAGCGFDTLIAAGGDGTLNEVVNGILPGFPGVRMGVLPLASGGDFARGIGLSGLQQAVEVLAEGHLRRVDAVLVQFRGRGSVASRYFINAASIGLGAEVAQSVGHCWRRLPGRFRYLAVAAGKLATRHPCKVRLTIDGVPISEVAVTTIALANGRFQGGGILIAPQAAMEDGRMDITLVEHVGLGELAANIRLLYSGGIHSHPKVHHWRAARVCAEAEDEVLVELDGEPAGTLPLEAEVLQGAVSLICPAWPQSGTLEAWG